LGTLYPVFVEVITGTQVSVGRPFFDRMAVPLSFGLLLAMGIGPFIPYRRAAPAVLWRRLRLPLLVASAATAGLVVLGLRSVSVVAVSFVLVAMAVASIQELITTVPALRLGPVIRLLRTHRGYWGGQLSHLGLATLALGIAVTSTLADRATLTLERGESVEALGYDVTFSGTRREDEPGRDARIAAIVLREGGRVVHVAEPALTTFTSQVQAVGTPSVWSTPGSDVYVALTSIDSDRVGINVYRYPLMWLVWAGGSIVALGGFWALAGRRRQPTSSRSTGLPSRQTSVVTRV
ncbi:MAG: cytochrome c-type biogenesis CcmF C-terminal domain-containing protein, partial [Dehalococcoidia bacterium]